ncbi:hypothetical protein AKJ09_07763 [Labilithrix luteola]|uniref:Uncharacterized protein n=1 Tax=Labilithrix luteola TaxID=1391654 RepID=A0A0K1Q6R4_9BACT|nr:ABATE domain-containing protein [Labilithrix luteola]AKV01100.1 hypothetical protein AKJ09_07763 [Labilithrix luteola]
MSRNSYDPDEIARLEHEVRTLRRALRNLLGELARNGALDANAAAQLRAVLGEAESAPPSPREGSRTGGPPYRGGPPREDVGDVCARCGVPLAADDAYILLERIGTVCPGCWRSYDKST